MAREFQVIETQEQLDEVLKGRLGELNKKHSEATAELQSKLDALTNENASLSKTIEESKKRDEDNAKTLGDLQGKVKAYELAELKARIARENNIPYEMASRITGEDEEAMKADAIALSKYLQSQAHRSLVESLHRLKKKTQSLIQSEKQCENF